MQILWFFALVSTICLEGLGRKYLPQVPAVGFYFAKDAVLVLGFFFYRPPAMVTAAASHLLRGYKQVLVVAMIWTALEMLNPEGQSYVLAFIGLRAYWLWWLAPLVIAGLLQWENQKRRAIYALLVMSLGIAVLAAFQFAAPPDSALNLYSVVDGQEVYATEGMVHSTGRARVSGTFSYISGFSAFTILVPTLLLSIGLDSRDRKLQRLTFIVTTATAAVLPMSGSRSSIILGVAVLVVTTWTAGLFATRIGRRVILGASAATVFAVVAFPDAFVGVQNRFEDQDETNSRVILGVASILPPAALVTFDYPPLGIGTGMMQNARYSMRLKSDWDAEIEAARFLIELGPVGFVLVWGTKLGLAVALVRAYRILKRAGRRGAAGAAISYVILTMVGSATFDHIWQALYFMGLGFILGEVVSVLRQNAAAARQMALRTSEGHAPQEIAAERPAGPAPSRPSLTAT